MAYKGYVTTLMHIPFFDVDVELGFFYYIISVVLICGIVNSVNLTDGIDGLATASGAIMGGTLAIIGWLSSNIIMAIGATPNTKIVRTTSGLQNDERKFLVTREVPYGMTTRQGVFAGGDVANRQATVVHAMQDAKKVALGIAQYVDAVKLMKAIANP